MRKLLLLTCFLGALSYSYAQDFTNKGKEFWIGYGNHQQMFAGNTQGMDLYITSDVNTTVIVEIPGLGITNAYAISANQITRINIPNSAVLDGEGIYNKGIHVMADKPVVVYAHIFFASVSGATLCLPVSTLGRDYYSVNFRQVAQANLNANSYSYFFVAATEDNTTIEIVPSANTQTLTAGTVNTINLQKGQIYQALSNTDLTGSTIKSINTGGGCKKIAVFCGSGRIGIGCAGGVTSSDNLYQQMYPTSTWGKKYYTVPSATRPRNYYRIIRPDPTSVVKLDGGIVLSGSFTNGLFHEFSDSNPHLIESDKPILVAQYFTTQDCGEPTANGDPEMIYLNPVEQTISKVTLTSMRLINQNNNRHYLNAVVKNVPGAINTFRIDGVSYASSFLAHPSDPQYAYAQIFLGSSTGTHTVTCDTPFNAIAYGLGQTESYGYSAGTNLKDLYQFVSIQNDYGTVSFPAGCKATPFKFAMTFPYQPTQIQWKFGSALNAFGLVDTTINSPVFDSSWVVDGRTLYRYKLNRTYTIPQIGTYPITILANNPTTDGCSGLQEIEYDLQIFERPIADFSFTHNGCVSDSVTFLDNTNGQGRTVTRWYWDFGDANNSTAASPKHKYATAGPKTVRHAAITDVGCLSDTATKIIPLSDPPVAKFGISAPFCEKSVITFTDSSTILTGTIVRWAWNLGDGTIINALNGNSILHTYANAGNYTVTLEVETGTGCRSLVYTRNIVINPKPLADFLTPTVCLPAANAQFTSASTIADGTQSLFTYLWNFGDGNTSTLPNPVNLYTTTGPFNVRLTVTSNNGCSDDTLKAFTTIFPQPRITVTAPPEICFGDSVRVAIKINNPLGLKIREYTCNWSNEAPSSAVLATGADSVIVYHRFINGGAQSVTVFVRGESPGSCLSDTITVPVYINALPLANYAIATTACEGQLVGFNDLSTVTDGTVNKWAWVFGNGNLSTIQNPSTTYATPGTYTSTLVVESTKGCVSSMATRPVIVNYLPVAGFSTPEICLADPFAQFTDSSRIGDNSESQFTYLWNFGDPNANAGNPNTSTLRNPQHRYNAVGQYTIGLTVTSKDGCVNSSSKSFTVNGAIPVAAFNVNSPAALCANKDVTINDASTVDFGSIVKVEVYWDYGNDPTIKTVDENPIPGKLYTHKYPDFGTPATRTFSVRYVAYSGINCINEITRTVTVNASPSIQFDPMSAVCEEIAPFQITAARELFGFSGTGTYSGNGIVSSNGRFSPAIAKPGIHTIRYSFSATNGCNTFSEQTIKVDPTPSIDAGPDRTVLEGGFIVLQAKASGNNLSFAWTPNTAIDNTTIMTPKVSPVEDITYTLKVTSGDGCVANDAVFVKVLKKPRVPNAFSPNGDGINDNWVIEYLESYPGATVEVFNRYGQMVYRSVGYGKPWDGRYNGVPLPVATYYWIINPKNGRQQMNGSVTIIR